MRLLEYSTSIWSLVKGNDQILTQRNVSAIRKKPIWFLISRKRDENPNDYCRIRLRFLIQDLNQFLIRFWCKFRLLSICIVASSRSILEYSSAHVSFFLIFKNTSIGLIRAIQNLASSSVLLDLHKEPLDAWLLSIGIVTHSGSIMSPTSSWVMFFINLNLSNPLLTHTYWFNFTFILPKTTLSFFYNPIHPY